MGRHLNIRSFLPKTCFKALEVCVNVKHRWHLFILNRVYMLKNDEKFVKTIYYDIIN